MDRGTQIKYAQEVKQERACQGICTVTDLAKRVRPIPVVDATLAPSYSFEGAGGLAPQPFWHLAAGTG